LRHHAVVEDVDYRAPRGLDRALFHKLAGGEWLNEERPIRRLGVTRRALLEGKKVCLSNKMVR
jgi:hypothetical protein